VIAHGRHGLRQVLAAIGGPLSRLVASSSNRPDRTPNTERSRRRPHRLGTCRAQPPPSAAPAPPGASYDQGDGLAVLRAHEQTAPLRGLQVVCPSCHQAETEEPRPLTDDYRLVCPALSGTTPSKVRRARPGPESTLQEPPTRSRRKSLCACGYHTRSFRVAQGSRRTSSWGRVGAPSALFLQARGPCSGAPPRRRPHCSPAQQSHRACKESISTAPRPVWLGCAVGLCRSPTMSAARRGFREGRPGANHVGSTKAVNPCLQHPPLGGAPAFLCRLQIVRRPRPRQTWVCLSAWRRPSSAWVGSFLLVTHRPGTNRA